MRHLIKLLCYKLGIGEVTRKLVVAHEDKIRARRLQQFGYEIIQHVHKLLHEVGVRYMAEFGTLIGICREGGVLRHDTDIDFSLPPHADVAKVVQTLTQAGFSFVRGFEYEGVITEITLSYNDIHVDFFLFFEDAEGFYYYDYVDNYDETHSVITSWTPRRLRYPNLKGIFTIPFHGCEVDIPMNYDEWLTAQYGNWRVPDSHWVYTRDNDKGRTTILDGKYRILSLDETLESLKGAK